MGPHGPYFSLGPPAPGTPPALAAVPARPGRAGPLTCKSFIPTSCRPFLSNRRMISPTRCRWTPSGLMATKVRSLAPLQAARRGRGRERRGRRRPTRAPQPQGTQGKRGPGPARTALEEAGEEPQHQTDHGGAALKGAAPPPRALSAPAPGPTPASGGTIVPGPRSGGADRGVRYPPPPPSVPAVTRGA